MSEKLFGKGREKRDVYGERRGDPEWLAVDNNPSCPDLGTEGRVERYTKAENKKL